MAARKKSNALHPNIAPKSRKPIKLTERFQGGQHRPRRFDNGLLDTSNVSSLMVPIVAQNANNRLLRMPPEVRNNIYNKLLQPEHLAIEVYTRSVQRGYNMVEEHYGIPLSTDGINHYTFPRGLRLPLVCRLFYKKLSAMVYSRTPFYFDFTTATAAPLALKQWAAARLPYQLTAITAVEPFFYLFYRYFLEIPTMPPRLIFPNLKRIFVPDSIIKCEMVRMSLTLRAISTAHTCFETRLRKREGAHVHMELTQYPQMVAAAAWNTQLNVRAIGGELAICLVSVGNL